MAVAFFTPPDSSIPRNETKYVDIAATDGDKEAGERERHDCGGVVQGGHDN